ncbi:hypothetical protein [Amycolatopsis sp. cg13]
MAGELARMTGAAQGTEVLAHMPQMAVVLARTTGLARVTGRLARMTGAA